MGHSFVLNFKFSNFDRVVSHAFLVVERCKDSHDMTRSNTKKKELVVKLTFVSPHL